MSTFNDLQIRSVLTSKLSEIGIGTDNKRELDLSVLGITGLNTAPIQILAGEYSSEEKIAERSWVEPFLVKSPQSIYTPSECGVSYKTTQMVVWIKTPLNNGLYFNEAVAGMIQEHFNNNLHLPLPNGDVVTILKTYQQATIALDSNSGRLFNRVFVDTEIYYKNQK